MDMKAKEIKHFDQGCSEGIDVSLCSPGLCLITTGRLSSPMLP